jgi:hypothetical protein
MDMSSLTDNAVAFVVRLLLAACLASFAAAIGYIFAWFMVVSFLEITNTTVLVMSTTALGVGAGLGAGAGWSVFEWSLSDSLVSAALGVLGGIGGAWGGMYYGQTVYIMGGMPGIAEMSGMVRGAIIGANCLPLALVTYRAIRRGRF